MRITGIAAAAVALGVLCGCHNGGVDQNTAQLRALNAVVDAEPLDVLVDDGVKVNALALDSTSSYGEINSGTRDVKVRSSTTQTVLSDKSTAFAEGTHDTLLLFGRRAAVQSLVLSDDTTAISTGNFRVRVVNLAPDTGIDLYLSTGDISSLPTTIASAGYAVVTGSADVTPGSWQVTITAAGTRDVLLQSTAQSFAAGTYSTIVVVPSPGGKLVNAVLLTQGAGATFLQNSTARLKATNAIADAAAVNFRADEAAVLLNVPFAASSSYVGVSQGSHSLQLELSNVPGVVATSLTRTLDPARDYSLVAAGTSAAPQLIAFSDDNSLPAAGFAKVRFANAMAGSAPADVQVNFASLVGGLAFGTASAYYSVAPGTTYTITFASNGGLSVLGSLSPAELDAGGVYTAYLLGASGAAQVRLIRDR